MTATRQVVATPRIALLDDYQRVATSLVDWRTLPAGTVVESLSEPMIDEDVLVERLAPYDVVVAMRERTPFPARVLERLPRLALLASTGVRNAVIDLDACRRLGIAVCGAQGSRTGLAGTSEIAWALMLALAKRLVVSYEAMRCGDWQPELADPLMGRTLGVVGLGKIGQRVAKVGQAFDMDVIAWSPNLTPERTAPFGVRAVSKAELFSQADLISIHLVLGPQTAGIVGAGELAAMKPTAMLVNTARGGLVDEPALVDALRGRRIGGAGLDVFWSEPMPADHPLLELDNVVLSPHLGYATREALTAFYRNTLRNLHAWLAGETMTALGG